MKQHKLYVGLILVTFLYFDSEVIQLVIDLKRKAEINRFSSHHARLVKKDLFLLPPGSLLSDDQTKSDGALAQPVQCPIMGEHKIQNWDNSAIGEYNLHGNKFYQ